VDEVSHSNKHNYIHQKKIVENLLSFEREKELCWRPLNQNPFHMFIKTLNEI
jgi:hypothetical protein